jgi:hypothetical protein
MGLHPPFCLSVQRRIYDPVPTCSHELARLTFAPRAVAVARRYGRCVGLASLRWSRFLSYPTPALLPSIELCRLRQPVTRFTGAGNDMQPFRKALSKTAIAGRHAAAMQAERVPLPLSVLQGFPNALAQAGQGTKGRAVEFPPIRRADRRLDSRRSVDMGQGRPHLPNGFGAQVRYRETKRSLHRGNPRSGAHGRGEPRRVPPVG